MPLRRSLHILLSSLPLLLFASCAGREVTPIPVEPSRKAVKNVMYAKIAAAQLSRADVVIHPEVGHIASGDFTKRHEAILEGEKAAQTALPKIRRLLGEQTR